MYTYNGVQPFVSITPVNQRYRWGAQHAWDLGLNLGFLDNKINVEITTYGKGSSNQLTELPTPFYTGFDRVAANWGAVVRNKGIEASVNANIIKKKDLQLNVWANISRNVNKLVSYPGIEQSPYATTYKVGQSLSTVYILHLTGVNPLTGDYSFEDYNKDGLITSYSNTFPGTGINDRYLAYDLNPKYFGGFGSDLTWKNYRLALAFGFSNQIGYPPYVGLSAGRMNNLVMPTDMMQNHWRKPGDNAKYPKFSTISDNRGSGFVNTSFLRLNSVNFSYSMPEKLTRRAGLQSCLFSLSVSNLFVITSYDMDPEIQSGSFNPIPRVIVGTLSFTL
jgi:hypothetical protein